MRRIRRLSHSKRHGSHFRSVQRDVCLQDLEVQLKEARQVTAESRRTIKTLEEELAVAKERLLIQENEILQKTEAVEKALDSQSKARDEVEDLKSHAPHFQQVLSSKQGPEGEDPQPRGNPSAETEAPTDRQREELCKTKQESKEEKMLLKEQLVKGLEGLVKKHAFELRAAQAATDANRKKMQKVGWFY
ncbi:UNVERIFIED_CONTAM: hypothetical protein K2H54_059195 [Gekko kuhli]